MDNTDVSESTVEADRLQKFVTRAISESNRMRGEVSKATEERDQLFSEYGNEAVSQWMQEHAEQVLSQQEIGIMERSTKQLSLNFN